MMLNILNALRSLSSVEKLSEHKVLPYKIRIVNTLVFRTSNLCYIKKGLGTFSTFNTSVLHYFTVISKNPISHYNYADSCFIYDLEFIHITMVVLFNLERITHKLVKMENRGVAKLPRYFDILGNGSWNNRILILTNFK